MITVRTSCLSSRSASPGLAALKEGDMGSPRTLRLELLLRWTVATVAGLVLGGASVAAPVVIDFEDLPAGGPGTPALVAVTSQYAAKGVTFTGPVPPVALDYSKGIAIPGFARSGVKAIEQCYSQEFCTAPFEMSFTAPQNRVKVWLGFRGPLGTARTLLLEAFDAGGASLGTATATLPPSGGSRPISIPLQVSTATPAITRAVVRFHPSALMNGLALDDLELETTAISPPVCAAGKPPTVTLTQPAAGSLQVDEFLLAGSVATETPLEAATLTVAGPGGTRTLDLLARGLVLPGGSSFGPVRVNGLLGPGSNVVSVSARNCKGTALASGGSLGYSPIPASTRFQLLGMEVTQAIQDMSNSVPLIADKRTLVRVYLRSSGPTIRSVRASLVGCRQLSDSSPAICGDLLAPPLVSLNAVTVDASTDLTAMRRDLTRSLNFELPPSWIKAGRVHYEIAALNIDGVQLGLPCDDCQNPNPRLPAFGRFYEYTSAPPVEVSLFEVGYGFGGDVVYPRKEDVFLLRSWLERAYPTSRVVAPNISLDAGIDGLPSCSRVNLHLIVDKLALAIPRAIGDEPSRKDRYYGLVSDAGGFMRGCSRPRLEILGFTLAEFDVGSGPAGIPGNPRARFTGWDKDASYADWYGAHEIGHLFGRNHPDACLDDAGRASLDPGFPFPGGFLSGPDQRYFGFDFGDAGFGLPRRVHPPDAWTDVMGYCDNQWISSYTYEGLLRQLRGKSASQASEAKATTADGLVVVGSFDPETSEVELENLLRLPNRTLTPRPGRSAFTLVLQDAAKRTLASYPFTPRPSSDGGEDIISEVVPYVAGTKRVAILQNGRELAARAASRNAPEVKILFPNGGEQLDGETVDVLWQGSDADGDVIAYSLLYSNDRGASWGAIAIDLSEPRATVDLKRLPGGSGALFRVVATDGFDTRRDDSDSPFSVPGKAPEVRIKSPGQNSVYDETQTLVLVGEAIDSEDGPLDGTQLQWSSDRQGTLGRGRSLAVTGLAPGRHRITLTAMDRSSTGATASIEINVTSLPPRVLAGGTAGCQPTAQRLCLQGGRFAVEAEWRDFSGRRGAGQAVPLSGETGYFWFFAPANVEVVFKLLDGRPLNGHWWAFYASLSNVEFRLTVTDTRSGESKSYFNPSGRFASAGDTSAFLSREKLAAKSAAETTSIGKAPAEPRSTPAKSGCVSSATSLCLQQGRFALEISWRDFAGRSGSGQAVPLTSDTGYFWFFDKRNVEVIVKILDGRPLNGRWWVFYGSLSNVEYTIRVTDTMTGATRTYRNPLGRFGSAGDTAAF